jgi:hypothetical protein
METYFYWFRSNGVGRVEEEEEVETVPFSGLDHGKLLKDNKVFQLIKTRLLL